VLYGICELQNCAENCHWTPSCQALDQAERQNFEAVSFPTRQRNISSLEIVLSSSPKS
jgi:hypothetical protein